MRIALILLTLPVLGAAPPATVPAAPRGTDAPSDSVTSDQHCRLLTETGGRGDARLRRLDELPPANAYAAMLRMDEKGCPDPVLYRRR